MNNKIHNCFHFIDISTISFYFSLKTVLERFIKFVNSFNSIKTYVYHPKLSFSVFKFQMIDVNIRRLRWRDSYIVIWEDDFLITKFKIVQSEEKNIMK